MNSIQKGLPSEVNTYHPVEFLGLEKGTLAYLNMHLENIKGGVESQLLVGHIIEYVSTFGLSSISSGSYFRQIYLEDLLEKCRNKGINLNDVARYNLDKKKLHTLSDNISIYQSSDIFTQTANIYSSSNYGMFHLLPFNRKISRTHVQNLVVSMKENGITSHPLMIYTDCIDGEWRYWIVDGQHRFHAFMTLGFPIHFTLYQKQSDEPITKRDIVRLVAQVNNTSKKWDIKTYQHAWCSLEIEDYLHIQRKYNQTKIPISIIIQAYSGFSRRFATERYMHGLYVIRDREIGDRIIDFIYSLRGIIPRGTDFQTAIINHVRNIPDYNFDGMKNKMHQAHGFYEYGDKSSLVLENLNKLYTQI